VRDVVAAVRRGAWVGVLADQNAGRRGEFVPFFGLPASTFRFAATIAARHGFPVYFAAAIRRGGRFRYEYKIHRWQAPEGLSRHDAERQILEAYSARLEAWAREVPEQYLWLHRRWKTRPPGEAPGPHLPAYPRRTPVAAASR
jgi:KDO2-lipid IV(A) lauroyltransferase